MPYFGVACRLEFWVKYNSFASVADQIQTLKLRRQTECSTYGTECSTYGTECSTYGTECSTYGTECRLTSIPPVMCGYISCFYVFFSLFLLSYLHVQTTQ